MGRVHRADDILQRSIRGFVEGGSGDAGGAVARGVTRGTTCMFALTKVVGDVASRVSGLEVNH
jgi:hypothetical protein